MILNARFTETAQTLSAKFAGNAKTFSANMGEIQTITKYIGGEPFDGSYSITPKVTAQTMPTKGKVMTDDVTVKAIPFFNVSNNSGGNTVYIAKEI